MKKVGRQIAKLRKENKITQMVLADQLSVSFQAISNWERGETIVRC
ncbi:helix-turn-helix domain-containing protein [Gottfriedia acidiceleris]